MRSVHNDSSDGCCRKLRPRENISYANGEIPNEIPRAKSKAGVAKKGVNDKENQKNTPLKKEESFWKNDSRQIVENQQKDTREGIKLRLRKSLIYKKRQNSVQVATNEKSSNSSKNSLASINKSAITPTNKTRSIKMVIRKSEVRRGREAASKLEGSEVDTSEEESESSLEESEPVLSDEIKPLKGRENEFNSIDTWIRESLSSKEPLTIYISGSPGTGKTATLRLVLNKWNGNASSTIINCVSIKTQKDIVEAIFTSQNCKERATLTNLQKFLKQSRKPLIAVLDEIDHLSNTSNALLYSTFKWPQQFTSKLIIIGIANSIDLTERLLPKLKLSHEPKTLVFSPYTKEKIKEILEERMKKEASTINEKAVELCARKVAAMSGDLRTALHVFKTTQAATSTSGNENATNGCKEVLGVLNAVYSSPLARAKLPLQPRLLLAVCLCMSTNKKTNLTSNTILSGYVKACDAIKVRPLENDDLSAAFQTLESQSFISTTSNGQIRLQVDSKTARNVISDNAMIDQISILNL